MWIYLSRKRRLPICWYHWSAKLTCSVSKKRAGIEGIPSLLIARYLSILCSLLSISLVSSSCSRTLSNLCLQRIVPCVCLLPGHYRNDGGERFKLRFSNWWYQVPRAFFPGHAGRSDEILLLSWFVRICLKRSIREREGEERSKRMTTPKRKPRESFKLPISWAVLYDATWSIIPETSANQSAPSVCFMISIMYPI